MTGKAPIGPSGRSPARRGRRRRRTGPSRPPPSGRGPAASIPAASRPSVCGRTRPSTPRAYRPVGPRPPGRRSGRPGPGPATASSRFFKRPQLSRVRVPASARCPCSPARPARRPAPAAGPAAATGRTGSGHSDRGPGRARGPDRKASATLPDVSISNAAPGACETDRPRRTCARAGRGAGAAAPCRTESVPSGRRKVSMRKAGRVRILGDQQRIVGSAEEAGVLAGPGQRPLDQGVRQRHAGGNAVVRAAGRSSRPAA